MRVLVIDDEPSIRMVVARALREAEVLEAADARAAFAVLAESPVDVVVLDVMLEQIDGIEMLARLRRDERFADLPVVLLTARVAERDHVRGWRESADAYVTKPFEAAELAAVVREVAAREPAERAAVRERELARAELLASIDAQFADP